MGYNGIIDIFLAILQPLFPYTFDPVFTPLLGLGSPLTGARITIIAVSIVLSGIISIVYYLLMDVDAYQELKEKREALNKKMKEARNEGDTEQANEHMKEMASMQKEFFMLMMKPMLASMVLFFFLLPWMYTTFTPIVTMSPADSGYEGTLQYNGYSQSMSISGSNATTVQIGGSDYEVGETFSMDGLRWKVLNINTDGEQATTKFAAEIVPLPVALPLVGDELGWLGTYILVSIPFTFIFRKMLGIQ